MHEAGIVKNVMDIIEASAVEQGYSKVTLIALIVGKARAVIPEGLYAGMEVYSRKKRMFSNCKLIIDEREIILECPECGHFSESEFTGSACPKCGCLKQNVYQGDELEIDYYLGE